ncbi:MAG: discoidin domain-containing protein [Saprospiraceae bacterium]
MKFFLLLFSFIIFIVDLLSSQCNTLLSQNGISSQSPGDYDSNSKANKSNNGIINDLYDWSCPGVSLNPYWEVDLLNSNNITQVVVYNRNCPPCVGLERVKNFTVFITSSPLGSVDIATASNNGSIYKQTNNISIANGAAVTLTIPNINGRYVRIWAQYIVQDYFNLSEVQVFGCTGSAPPTCSDGIKNGDETGVDCGGSSCMPCGSGTNPWTTLGNGIYFGQQSGVHIGKSNTNTGSENGYNLFVKGGIKSEKFKVELPSNGGWADFVFQKDYKLLPLRQLDSYIKQYQHLPNFPSEKSIMEAGGYEMSDIIKRQQMSIEELHLYIIDLELQIQKVRGLEKRLADLERILRKQ